MCLAGPKSFVSSGEAPYKSRVVAFRFQDAGVTNVVLFPLRLVLAVLCWVYALGLCGAYVVLGRWFPALTTRSFAFCARQSSGVEGKHASKARASSFDR